MPELRYTVTRQPAHESGDKQVDIFRHIGRLLCRLGFHDYQIIETKFGFGNGVSVEKDRCRRCGALYTHQV